MQEREKFKAVIKETAAKIEKRLEKHRGKVLHPEKRFAWRLRERTQSHVKGIKASKAIAPLL